MSDNAKTLEAMWPKPSDFQVVAHLVRAGLVESFHHGIAAVTNPEGKVIDSIGKSKRLIFPRSTVKPLQAVAMKRVGLNLENAQLAISAGSHLATKAHIELVDQILSSAGLGEDDLQCPSVVGKSGENRRASYNCSGKHAGFLAACVAAGYPVESYLEFDHPLQLVVKEVIEEYTAEPILFTTVDGCGAPLHTVTVEGLARAIGRFSRDDEQIRDAMLQNGWAVDDHGADDTLMLEAGIVAKLGAEGVFVAGTKEGFGVAVKIADGQLRAAALVALSLLHRNELISTQSFESLTNQIAEKVKGGDNVIGRLESIV